MRARASSHTDDDSSINIFLFVCLPFTDGDRETQAERARDHDGGLGRV